MADRSNEQHARRIRRLWVPIVLAGGGVALAASLKVVVKVPQLVIRPNTTGFSGAPVDTVPENTSLDVLSSDKGWLKVRTPSGKEGFVREGALTARAFTPAKVLSSADASSSIAGATAATKGLEPEARDYASGNSFNTAGVEKMIFIHDSITPEEFERFEREGKIGSAGR